MFDDEDQKQIPSQQSDLKQSNQPDIASNAADSSEKLEDIFEETDTAPGPIQDPSLQQSNTPERRYKRSVPWVRWIITLIILIVIIVGIAYAFLWYSANQDQMKQDAVNEQQIIEQQIEQEQPTQNTSDTTTPVQQVAKDTDADGLSDEEEARLGTSPIRSDSDQDSLSDFEEVRTWQTNPLNPDSDGDGFLDGEEVKGGYDPKGPGRITDVSNIE